MTILPEKGGGENFIFSVHQYCTTNTAILLFCQKVFLTMWCRVGALTAVPVVPASFFSISNFLFEELNNHTAFAVLFHS